MKTIKLRGIVISEKNISDFDKSLIILTKELGKIRVSAKAARKQKSQFLADSQIFTYMDFLVFEGRGFYSLTQTSSIERFSNISSDFEKFKIACELLLFCDKHTLLGAPVHDLLRLLLKSLSALSRNSFDKDLVESVFMFKFSQINGVYPSLLGCEQCETFERMLFCENGTVCDMCREPLDKTVKISKSAVRAINFVLASDINEIFNFKLSDDVKRDFISAKTLFVNSHLGASKNPPPPPVVKKSQKNLIF